MRFKLIIFIFLIITGLLNAQIDSTKQKGYLEDQIYIGLSYIILDNQTDGVNQNGFSNSLYLGFIKDLPTTVKGNFSFGVGLGYGRNTYFQNIQIIKNKNNSNFTLLDDSVSFKTNKFSLHNIEIPLEIRWRTSTIDKYKFWRVYAGAKLSYAFGTNTKFKTDNDKIKFNNISEIHKFQYGLTLAVGYGTWNFNFYYGLSDIFKNAALEDGTSLKMKDFRIGLIFYIL